MLDRVDDFLQRRSEITSDIRTEAINEAYLTLCNGRFVDAHRMLRLIRFPELEARAGITLVTNQDAYTLSTTMYTISYVEHQFDSSTTLGRWMGLKYKPHYNLMLIQPVNGRPFFFSWHQNTVYLRSVPGTAENGQTLRVWYYKIPTQLSAPGDSPVISELFHPLIPILAASNLATRFSMGEKASELEGRFAAELAKRRLPHEMESSFNVTSQVNRGA